MIPTREECLRLMSQHGMLNHIVSHCMAVARVALFLSKELNKRGQGIDLRLVEAASLLHDLTKTECLKTKEDHARTASECLKGLGYERVGQIVAEHVVLAGEKDAGRVSEEEIVNYADKRVQHDRIVSLSERFRDLRDRYGKNERSLELIEALEQATSKVERKIFSQVEISPEDLQSPDFRA
jgi:uncharacterized protein